MIELPLEFIHEPPKDYRYEIIPKTSNVDAIWIISRRRFTYNDNNPARSIWGFYNKRTRRFHSPINSKRVGAAVAIEDTSPYSAMQIHYKGLESFFC